MKGVSYLCQELEEDLPNLQLEIVAEQIVNNLYAKIVPKYAYDAAVWYLCIVQ